MLSTRFFDPESVRHHALVDGRLLHVRAGQLDQVVDFYSVYQHPWNKYVPKQDLLQRRAHVWSRLSQAVYQQPKRNLLVLGGDMNVQLCAAGGTVGSAVLCHSCKEQVAEDGDQLQRLLDTHNLCARNTWTGPKPRMMTYTLANHATQIDYIITRAHSADAVAKQSVPHVGFPIADRRLGGQHRPIEASLRIDLKPWFKNKQCQATYDQAAMLRAATDNQTIEALNQFVEEKLASQSVTAESINEVLKHACSRFFPRQPQRPLQAHHETLSVQQPIKHIWRLWRKLRQVGTACGPVSCAFQAWSSYMRFKRQKAVQKASRQSRRERVEMLLDAAGEAARRYDTHALFQVVRRLAPQQGKRRVQIHSKKGQLLSPADELQELRTHYSEVFKGAPFDMHQGVDDPPSCSYH